MHRRLRRVVHVLRVTTCRIRGRHEWEVHRFVCGYCETTAEEEARR